ncbi:MAG: alpha/beta fold hydrolase [Rhodobacteraceae bacterium]|nr:alpha/beta fold hydrolase [Paracoccaceae bacterium]
MTDTVVFQHGLGGGAEQVAQNWPAGTGFRRITLPNRGHDGAPLGSERPFSIPMFAADVLRGAPAEFVAAGISMGAAIALNLACHHPERVRALILIRPAWTFVAAPRNMQPITEIAALLLRLPPDEAAEAFRSSATGQHLAAASPDNLASLLGYALRSEARTFAQVLQDIATQPPGVSLLQVQALRLPCLIIGNEMDAVHPMSSAEALAEAIPNAQLIRVAPKAQDRPRHQAEICAAVAGFLAEQPWSPV